MYESIYAYIHLYVYVFICMYIFVHMLDPPFRMLLGPHLLCRHAAKALYEEGVKLSEASVLLHIWGLFRTSAYQKR